MRKIRVIALAATFALMAMAAAVAGTANASHSDVIGHVYINNNMAGANSVSAFDRHSDGSLSTMVGSPFRTGGAGTGATLASQGAVQLSSDGRYLLTVNAGSNQISVLRVRADGSLELADVVPSGGVTPLSIAVHDDLVFVANGGMAGMNYTGFTLDSAGHLTPILGSTVSLSGAAPVDILFNRTGTLLAATKFGANDAPSQIDTFAVSKSGLLTPAPTNSFTAEGLGPFGSAFRPTNPSQLFVSNAHNGAVLGTVSAFNLAGNGAISSVSGSPFRDYQTAPCWVEISPDGYHLFAVNTAEPSITTFTIAPNGALSAPVTTGFNEPVGFRPFDARMDATGRFLYVVGAGKVAAFTFNGGTLNEVLSSPIQLPVGAVGTGIAVN